MPGREKMAATAEMSRLHCGPNGGLPNRAWLPATSVSRRGVVSGSCQFLLAGADGPAQTRLIGAGIGRRRLRADPDSLAPVTWLGLH